MPLRKTISSIQLLRFAAALSVVLAHVGELGKNYFAYSPAAYLPKLGNFGVSLFFIISGFIMVITAYGSAGSVRNSLAFLERRIIRIVPLYWLATTLLIAIMVAAPSLVQKLRLGPWHTLASFLFVPAFNNVQELTPLLNVGWTLNYEMYFYLLFAIGLLLPRRLMMPTLLVIFCASILGRELLQPRNIYALFYGDPYVSLFVMGMVVGLLVKGGRYLTSRTMLFLAMLWIAAGHYYVGINLHPAWLWGPPCTLILWIMVSLEQAGQLAVPKWCVVLGDSSYSLYLTHSFVLAGSAKIILAPILAAYVGPVIFTVVLAGSAVLGGHAVYLGVERKLTVYLKKNALLSRPRAMAYSNKRAS